MSQRIRVRGTLERLNTQTAYVSTHPELTEQFQLNVEKWVQLVVQLGTFLSIFMCLAVVAIMGGVYWDAIQSFMDLFSEPLVFASIFVAYVVEEALSSRPWFKSGVKYMAALLWFFAKRFRPEIRLQHTQTVERVPVDLDIRLDTGAAHWTLRLDEAQALNTETSWEPFPNQTRNAPPRSGALELEPGKTAVNLTQTPEGQPQLELRSTHNARVGLAVNLEPNRWVAPHRELPQLERAGALDLEPEAQQQLLQALSHVSDTHNLRLPQGLNRPNEVSPQHEPATVSQAVVR